MLSQILLAAFLAAPPWADPFAPAGPLAPADFFEPNQPKAKPAPYLASAEGLEWWALEQDWAETVAKAAPLVEVMSSRQNQRIIYSALLCHAVQLLTADDHSTTTARKRLIAIGLLATERLEKARIVPLACGLYPVERLVNCLSLLPGPECSADTDLAAQYAAATRLEEATP